MSPYSSSLIYASIEDGRADTRSEGDRRAGGRTLPLTAFHYFVPLLNMDHPDSRSQVSLVHPREGRMHIASDATRRVFYNT